MLLRIEDTDRERSTAAAIDAIIEGLTWLGLDWAGEPVSQFGRRRRHRQVADVLAQGKALSLLLHATGLRGDACPGRGREAPHPL